MGEVEQNITSSSKDAKQGQLSRMEPLLLLHITEVSLAHQILGKRPQWQQCIQSIIRQLNLTVTVAKVSEQTCIGHALLTCVVLQYLVYTRQHSCFVEKFLIFNIECCRLDLLHIATLETSFWVNHCFGTTKISKLINSCLYKWKSEIDLCHYAALCLDLL